MSGGGAVGGVRPGRISARTGRVPERLKVVGPPVAAAVVALALLSGWTAVGGAGRPQPVEAGPGWLLLPTTGGATATAAFFTVRNPGDIPDELTGASWEFGGKVTLKRHLHQGASGRWEPVTALPVPERGELVMSPEDADLMITNPPALTVGQWVEFTLTFRHSPELRLKAEVVKPGGRRSG
ncbi:copper chaperone PCu(A)C [Streptomyces sp. BE20]|uniref:copper chaperone PCu(A)C n=1 Tax=unclassified Streptomyces TaxID=2593676 RepID=UPI002E7A6FB2|nr:MULTISPECIES: copper chaperone PCu(A)C [unclassified Streptomyces]MED7948474.1 copper chaperone PCu(A)C [Streptomyces sp. BE303]MEE1826190.1 copper chaperone PCu(A)C [Streptomyces sp. BE20]